ncbi:MAG: T9SS type A sorting domain-containing protein [Ignavibacteria bacterium]|nr:T9SS type A sorting domain-containing protein [Ignavibacteria bacterium]
MYNTASNEIVHKNYLKNLELPEDYRLFQNFPQSFYKVTRIAFEIPRETNVRLVIYDVFGRDINTLLNKELEAGSYEIKWNASNLGAGIYYYKIYADEFVDSKKILLLKN